MSQEYIHEIWFHKKSLALNRIIYKVKLHKINNNSFPHKWRVIFMCFARGDFSLKLASFLPHTHKEHSCTKFRIL